MIKFYNTLTRKKEIFKPIKSGNVGVYSCGPTVYWNQHIGNFYAYIQWDILVRFLRYSGYKTKWVMNITDVGHMTSDQDSGEDKMEKGAKREGLSVWQIAEKYIKQFLKSTNLLNIKQPDILCRATKHIKEQIDLIKKIEKNGFTYKTKSGLIFDTSKFPDYQKFAKLNLEKQKIGKRIEIDKEKKQPWDFMLWFTNKPNHIMQWNSPWGRGFPGWHIECTGMSIKYLGNKFDIHTGGKDHIPVHHTNEIAQSYGAFRKETANYWLHNEMLLLENKKISKSLGNIVLVTDLIEKGFNPLSLRYLILTSHYRQGLNFTWKGLRASQNALNNLYEKIRELKNSSNKIIKKSKNGSLITYKKQFIKHLEEDLNTPKALSLIWNLIKDKNISSKDKYSLLLDFDKVLGLNIGKIKKIEIPFEIKKLVEIREKYRQEKNWKLSDEVRQEIQEKGYLVEDTKKGPKIKKLSPLKK